MMRTVPFALLSTAIVVSAAFAPRTAVALEFVDEGLLLGPPATGWFSTGINAPTIGYDADATQYVMYFESQDSSAPSGCSSEWVIGRATSPDGLLWTLDSAPVLQADSSAWYACSVAQPAVVYDGSIWRLWFKGTTATGSKGIGYAESSDGVTFTVDASAIVESTGTLGDPTAAMIDGQLYLYYTMGDSIYYAYSADDGATWTSYPDPVIEPDPSVSWRSTGVSGGSLTVLPGGGDLNLFFYGYDATGTKGFGTATSVDGITFGIGPDQHLLDSGSAPTWSHWDVVQTVGSDFLAFYSQDGSAGLKSIGLAVSGSVPWDAPIPRVVETVTAPEDTYFAGNSGSAMAGFGVANAGDLDGDGTDDLLIGAPSAAPGDGNAFIVYGGQDLTTLSLDDVGVSVEGVVLRAGAAADWAGFSVSGAGDVDGDGYADILVGAPAWTLASEPGAAYLLYGPFPTSGTIDLEDIGDESLGAAHRGTIFRGESGGDELGWSVAAAGDVDGDGYDDVIMGAPGISAHVGGAYLALGPVAETEINVDDIGTAYPGSKIGSLSPSGMHYTGYAVAGIGDFNGDGNDDVAVSAPEAPYGSSGSYDNGAVFVFHGPLATIETGNTTDFRVYGAQSDDLAGLSVAGAGDLDLDGYDDFMVTARRRSYDDGRGQTWVFYGPQTGVRRSYVAETRVRGTEPETTYNGIYASTVAASAGDVDGDGYPDIVVGASFQDEGLADAGAAYVFTQVGKDYYDYSEAASAFLGSASEDYYGCSVAGLDFNGDGYSDVAVGARGDDFGSVDGGSVTILYGAP